MSSQMPSIQQAMDAMHLQQPSSKTIKPKVTKPKATKSKASKATKAKTTRPPNSYRISLPIPRRVGVAKEHRIFYGFEVSTEWLVEYCEQNAHRILGYDPDSSETAKIFLTMKLLARSSNIQNVTIEGVICRVSEPSLPLGGNKSCVPIVCVCSSMNSSYERRPTEAQLNKLRSIVKKEPEWFVDINPPSYYGY